MKRRMIAAALACLACTAGLSACGGSANAENVYRIAVIIKHTDEHFKKVMAGAEACASEHPNVEIDIQSPTSATAYDEQLNMIETVLHNDGIDAVVLAPLHRSRSKAHQATHIVRAADAHMDAADDDEQQHDHNGNASHEAQLLADGRENIVCVTGHQVVGLGPVAVKPFSRKRRISVRE